MQLKGKKVLITGGTRGIGKSIVQELIGQGVTHLAIIARDKKSLKELSETYPDIKFIRISGDVADIDVLREAAARIEDKWGHLDVLINNAGIVSAGPMEELPDEEVYDQVAVNYTAVLLLTKYCIPLLKSSGEGAILNISSGLGLIGMPFYAVYGSTKAAVKQFSDSIRRELAPFNISVTCSFPTATATDMMQKFEGREMDSPQYVAKRSIEALVNEELHVVFGGEQREKDSELNFLDPKKYDGEVAKVYEQYKESSEGHKAM